MVYAVKTKHMMEYAYSFIVEMQHNIMISFVNILKVLRWRMGKKLNWILYSNSFEDYYFKRLEFF